jgi:hypothetical protein
MTIRVLFRDSLDKFPDKDSIITTLPFSNQDKIRQSVKNDGPGIRFDDAGQNCESRRQTRIAVREHVDIRTFNPRYIGRSVNGFFDVCSVKVERCRLRLRKRTASQG